MSKQERQAQRSEVVADQGESVKLASGTWGPAFQPDFWGQQLEVRDEAHGCRGREAGARSQMSRACLTSTRGVHFLMCQIDLWQRQLTCFDLHVALGG
jgi:hypothetical protein